MVQRKPARKRPKDPGAVVLRGGAAQPPRGDPAGSRGGGGAARAPLPVPGYMRPTSCSDARAAATGVAPAPPPPPRRDDPVRAGKVVFTAAAAAVPRVGRATCSSTLKGPSGAGASGARVCTYGYCSLKGHAHASAVAPLGAFVASRRRLIKTQQSMKLKGASPFRKPNNKGAVAGDGFFVGIRAGAGAAAPTAGSDVSCSASDLPAEEEEVGAMVVGRVGYVMFGHLSCCGGGDYAAERRGRAEHFGASADGSCGSSDVVSDASSVELLLGTTRTKHHRGREEEAALVFHEEEDFGACKSDISEELDAKHKRNISGDTVGNTPKESSVDSVSSSALSGISFEDVSSACADAASSRKNKSSISRRRITSEEGVKQMRPFKPKPPNFLPAETGPEAEKVDLRHQTADDRRTAEEWMVDFALRKAVKKLARAQKRKVEMLVQAFETVLPTAGNEKPQPQQDNDTASFTLARPSQACS